jgi:spermidine synthase
MTTIDGETTRRRPSLLFVLFFLSGATGLVYQILWLRQLTLVLGATAYASSAVLSTFMGGLALGSYLAGRRADRWTSHPLRIYGRLEIGIAAYAATIPLLLRALTPAIELAWDFGADRHFAILALVKFAGIVVLILPATTLMGATLPVLARIAGASSRGVASGVGGLYAVNTFGAVAGTIAAAFFVLPTLGMTGTLIATVALNAAVGVIAYRQGGAAQGGEENPIPQRSPAGSALSAGALRMLSLVFMASGFGAMALEVAWTRGLALVLGSSVYAYASMLTAFLLGLAAGAAAASRWLARRRVDSGTTLSAVLALAGLLSFLTAFAIQALPRIFAEIYFRVAPPPGGWFVVQVILSLTIMFPATFALGWVFPLVLDLAGPSRGISSTVGRVYAANTFGTIAGAVAAGFLALPLAGVSATLAGVAALQLLLGGGVALGLTRAGPRARYVAAGILALAAALCLVEHPAWDALLMNSGVYMNVQDTDRKLGWSGFVREFATNNELVYAKEGLTASVLVGRQPASGDIYLAVNGKIDASSRGDLETQVMAGHLPLLFHPNPQDVLIVGLASGISVGSAATHPVGRIRVVEVEATMVGAARCFAESNGGVLDDPRVTVSINDARNELQFSRATYDVIVSEPSNPWMTVASNLFTEEYFRIVKSRLRPDGIFGQWLQTYCLQPDNVRSILTALRRSFRHVLVFETLNGVDLLVIASERPLDLDGDRLDARMTDLRVRIDLGRVGVVRSQDIYGRLQSGGEALDRVLARSPVNNDDNGRVEFAAPKALYLDTQDANMATLQGDAEDPMATILALTRQQDPQDRLRLYMIECWLLRDQRGRAERAARFARDPSRKEEILQALSDKPTAR